MYMTKSSKKLLGGVKIKELNECINVPYMKVSGLANFLKSTLGPSPRLYRIPIILILSSCLYFALGAKLNSLQGRVELIPNISL